MAFRTKLALILLSLLQTADASPIVVDANGRIVGFYQGARIEGYEYGVSATGYRFGFNRETGRLEHPSDLNTNSEGRVFFTSSDCTGQAYIQAQPSSKIGMVVPAAYPRYDGALIGDPLVFYLPQTGRPPIQTVMRGSSWEWAGSGLPSYPLQCVPDQTAPQQAYPLQPNDPDATGIPTSRFQAPLRVISSWLFRDGFEQPLSGTSPTGEVWGALA
jgi:hypothetical protein